MNNINILDCTLRDGGYINNWEFDSFNFRRIINSLKSAQVNIIECGYINDSKKIANRESTIFRSIEELEENMSFVKKDNSMYVAMINYGDCDIDRINDKKEEGVIDGFRIAFKKSDWKSAIKDVEILIGKGYKVFVQPMVTLSYSKDELSELISACNNINPYTLYIVDSFGAMKSNDIEKLTCFIGQRLNDDIRLGFHGHNNLQLAYSNSIKFIECLKDREIIIDSSLFGMGRGAGNLNTELICNYLNNSFCKNYNIDSILEIIDNYVARLYKETSWGYSLAHYLSAIYNCHPNYSTFLVNKKTLTIPDMHTLLKKLDNDEKVQFNKKYIENLYIKYNSNDIGNNDKLIELKRDLINKDIYVLVPGRSLPENLDKVKQDESIVVSINHVGSYNADFYFFSNQKRYMQYLEKVKQGLINYPEGKFIFTSNIHHIEDNNDSISVNYSSLLGISELESDNSSILFLNLLQLINIKSVFVVGFDGYMKDDNYIESSMEYDFDQVQIESKNKDICREISFLAENMNIYFLTKSIYEKYTYNFVEDIAITAE